MDSVRIGDLSKALNVSENDILQVLQVTGEDGTTTPKGDDEIADSLRGFVDTRIIKAKIDAREQQVLGRAKKEALTEFEKNVVTEMQLDGVDKKGIDLVKHVYELGINEGKKTVLPSTPIEKMEEKDLLSLEKVQSIVEKNKKQLIDDNKAKDKRIEDIENEFAKFKDEISRRESDKEINEILLREMDALGVQYDTNEERRQNQKEAALSFIKSKVRFGKDANGKIQPVDEANTMIYDGNTSTFLNVTDVVKRYNTLPIVTVNAAIGSPHKQSGAIPTATATKFVLTAAQRASDEVFYQDMRNAEPEKRQAMVDAFKAYKELAGK